ncbi:MAG: copper chaperone PCu(A)C [Methylophilaceae bacterium]|nr:copper chaperone PCu(A)C [Methylophilaceae bacterium]
MRNKIFLMFGLVFFLINAKAFELKAESAFIKAPKPGQTVTAGFINLKSSEQLSIKNISSNAAGKIEIHTMKMEKGPYGDAIMKMRKIENPIIQANKEFILKPGADHLMLFDLKNEINVGGNMKLEFTLVDKKNIEHKKEIVFVIY